MEVKLKTLQLDYHISIWELIQVLRSIRRNSQLVIEDYGAPGNAQLFRIEVVGKSFFYSHAKVLCNPNGRLIYGWEGHLSTLIMYLEDALLERQRTMTLAVRRALKDGLTTPPASYAANILGHIGHQVNEMWDPLERNTLKLGPKHKKLPAKF